jgi:hypothetical protein
VEKHIFETREFFINEEYINQVLQLIKRIFIFKDTQNRELLGKLELSDLAKLVYKIKPVLTQNDEIIRDRLYRELKTNIITLEKYNEEVQKAIVFLASGLGVPLPIGNLTSLTESFQGKWNKKELQFLTNVNGNDILKILEMATSPFSFYEPGVQKYYDALVLKFTPPEIAPTYLPIVHIKRIASDGKEISERYPVYYLDKDWSTGEPLPLYTLEYKIDRKSGVTRVEPKISVTPGRFPYIKLRFRTVDESTIKEVWREVYPSKVRKEFSGM